MGEIYIQLGSGLTVGLLFVYSQGHLSSDEPPDLPVLIQSKGLDFYFFFEGNFYFF